MKMKKGIIIIIFFLCSILLIALSFLAYKKTKAWLAQEPTSIEGEVISFSQMSGEVQSYPKEVSNFQSLDSKREILLNTSFILTCNLCLDYEKEIIEKETLRNLLLISLKQDQAEIEVDPRILKDIISSLSEKINVREEIEFNGKKFRGYRFFLNTIELQERLRGELTSLSGIEEGVKEVPIDPFLFENPITDGSYAPKYLEVDISQQKLYQWDNEQLQEVYIISTGRENDETPQEIFKIKNRYENAYSPVAELWTPYWMAFTFDFKNSAWLGLHELPYYLNENGVKVRRPFDTLGKPVTGGCIQLNVGDAKRIFDWTEVGIPLIIHE